MFDEKNLDVFLNQKNYDVRVSGNARWMDQKCTPDVVCIISDCILNYIDDNKAVSFFTKDIWDSEYAQNISELFSKPNISSKSAQNEYDKFFQQPMELLSYAGVLVKEKDGNKNKYTVINKELLSYLAIRERNALNFLIFYIIHVLKDSGIYDEFRHFYANPIKEEFQNLKKFFEDFTIKYTAIKKNTEPRRIFTKIINPLAFYFKTYGTERGHLSNQKITYDQLMYNRLNFRDLSTDKPKDITRNEYEPTLEEKIKLEKYWKYISNKAKKFLRKFNDEYNGSKSECSYHLDDNNAIHMHHIFPESEYPHISGHLENLIALTASQHLNKAHPNGNTRMINKDYQYLLLISKSSSIEYNLNQNDIPKIYDFDRLKEVLATGFDDSNIYNIPEMNFIYLNNIIENNFS